MPVAALHWHSSQRTLTCEVRAGRWHPAGPLCSGYESIIHASVMVMDHALAFLLRVMVTTG